MRRQERPRRRRNGGKLHNGERRALLDFIITDMAECGDLNHLSDEERGTIRDEVLRKLDREKVRR